MSREVSAHTGENAGMLKLDSLSRRVAHATWRYGLAIVSVAVALAITSYLERYTTLRTPLFYIAIIISAWFSGMGPGLLAVALSTLALDYYFAPRGQTPAVGDESRPFILLFSLSAIFACWICVQRRRAEKALKNARDELAARVEERTAKLRRVNEELHSEIAESKRMEEKLRERADLLDLTHDTVFVRDMNDVITYWNRGAEELYGWSSKEAIGQSSHILMQTIFPKSLEEINKELLRTGRWEGELIHTKRDQTQVTVASRWSLQHDDQKRPVAILETNNDITERKRVEEALQRHANMLEQTHDAILAWEFPGTIMYWNRGAEQLYGFSREEAFGQLSHDILHTEHPLPTAVFEEILARDGEWTGELTQTTRDGRKIIVESRHVLMREAGDRRLVLEANRDITERKRAEDAIQKAQAELAHVTRVASLGEMTASIAHEVNQPLAAIVTNANACLRWLAHRSPNLDEACQAATRIIKEGNRASEVISRVRGLVKKSDPDKDKLHINDVILEVIALARSEVVRHRVVLQTQ